jgi:hypothetical protein
MKLDHERLLKRAARAFGDVSPAEAVAKTRAIIGPGKIPASETAAEAAMTKLKHGEAPDPSELLALEFVIRVMRPAPASHAGLLDGLDVGSGNVHPPATVTQWNAFRTAVRPLLDAVGRIDHPQLGHIGTGFLVAPDRLATNRHVLDQLSGGTGILPTGGATVRFKCELNETEPPATKARILRVLDIHPRLDIALLEIEQNAARPTLPLDVATPLEDGHPVVVIGFPAESAGSNPLFGDAIFNGRYGVKRGALGELLDPDAPLLYHDCTTLGGNSGSPIFSLASRQVVGIHRSGAFTYRNEGLAAAEVQTVLSQT